MKRKVNLSLVLVFFVFFITTGSAMAVSISVDADATTANVEVSWNYDSDNKLLTINETWLSDGELFWELNCDGVEFSRIQIEKHKINSTGVDWISFEEELMQPVFGATGFITDWTGSNDLDQLDFAQGSSLPRTSTSFSSVYVDELAERDFIQFYNGIVLGDAGTDIQSFYVDLPFQGDPDGAGPPFALREQPNVAVVGVPEPATFLLFGTALIGIAALRRKVFKYSGRDL